MRAWRIPWHQLQQSIPAILAGLGVLSLVGIAMFLVRRSSNWVRGAPRMEVEPLVVDSGAVPDSAGKSFTIAVTNTGTGILHFQQEPYVEVLEGCCPPRLIVGTMTVEPGRSTRITSSIFRTSPGGDGSHDYADHLVTNDPQQRHLVVNVRSNWSE